MATSNNTTTQQNQNLFWSELTKNMDNARGGSHSGTTTIMATSALPCGFVQYEGGLNLDSSIAVDGTAPASTSAAQGELNGIGDSIVSDTLPSWDGLNTPAFCSTYQQLLNRAVENIQSQPGFSKPDAVKARKKAEAQIASVTAQKMTQSERSNADAKSALGIISNDAIAGDTLSYEQTMMKIYGSDYLQLNQALNSVNAIKNAPTYYVDPASQRARGNEPMTFYLNSINNSNSSSSSQESGSGGVPLADIFMLGGSFSNSDQQSTVSKYAFTMKVHYPSFLYVPISPQTTWFQGGLIDPAMQDAKLKAQPNGYGNARIAGVTVAYNTTITISSASWQKFKSESSWSQNSSISILGLISVGSEQASGKSSNANVQETQNGFTITDNSGVPKIVAIHAASAPYSTWLVK